MNWVKSGLAVGLAVLLVAAVAPAKRRAELFGLELGAPVALPECPVRLIVSNLPASLDRSAVAEPCVYKAPGSDDQLQLHFKLQNIPPYFGTSGFVLLRMHDGRLASIYVPTNGIKSQDELFAQLRAKFGKPVDLKITTEQNMMGAKFRVVRATWKVGTDFVRLAGTSDSFTEGSIMAVTADHLDREIKAQEQRDSERPRL
jgi:hypothetical protein